MEPVYTITPVKRRTKAGTYDVYVVRRGHRKLATVSCGTGRVYRWYDKRGHVEQVERRIPSMSDAGTYTNSAMTTTFVIMLDAFGEKAAWSMAGRARFENTVMGFGPAWNEGFRKLPYAELFAEYTEATRIWKS